MAGPQHQIFFIFQQHGDVADLKSLLNQQADFGEQFFQIQHRRRLLGDGIDGFQLRGAPPLQRIQPRILQGHGRLGGKQRQQVDGLRIEVVEILALAIQHTHNLVAHHERDGQLRACVAC